MAISSTKPTVAISQSGSDNDVDVLSSALPTGASTETTLALIKAKTDNIDVALSTRTKPADQQHVIVDSSALPTGAATETTLGSRLSESDFDTKTGSLTEAAPASDTASSGLNGRLQRIAQRITSLIALLPAALGAGGGLKVDGSGTALPVSGTVTANDAAAATGGYSKVKYNAQTTTVQTVKGSAGKLGGWYVYNPNASVAFVQLFDTSSAVTLGTTVPDMILGIPPSAAANLLDAVGIDFTNGIKLACTTTEQGLTAPGTGLTVNMFFK